MSGSNVVQLAQRNPTGALSGSELLYIVQNNGDTGGPVSLLPTYLSTKFLPLGGGTVTGVVNFEPGTGLAGLALFSPAWLAHFGWLQIDANGGGTVAWNANTTVNSPGVNPIFASANVGGTAGNGTTHVPNNAAQFLLAIPSDTLNSDGTDNGFNGLNFTHNIDTGAQGPRVTMQLSTSQFGTMTQTNPSAGVGVLNLWQTIDGAGSGNSIVCNPQLIINSGATGVPLAELIEGNITVVTGAEAPGTRGGVTMFSAGDLQATVSDYAYGAFSSDGSPGWLMAYQIGRAQTPFGVDATNGTILGVQQQTNGVTFAGMAAKNGVDFAGVDFNGYAWQSSGALLDPGGVWYLGTGKIAPITSGLSVDVTGFVGGSPTIADGGVSYKAGDLLTGPYGTIIEVGTVNGLGTITAWAGSAFVQPPYNAGGAGTSTIALAGGSSGGVGGQAAVVGVTWTQQKSLEIQPTSGGKLGFNGATPIVQPTVTGSKGSNAALASLMAALGPSGLGLVVDSTS